MTRLTDIFLLCAYFTGWFVIGTMAAGCEWRPERIGFVVFFAFSYAAALPATLLMRKVVK